MKRLLLSTVLALGLAVGMAGTASAAPSSPLSLAYRAKYCYPTGSYYVAQLSNPWNAIYYAVHNAYYLAKYGPTTRYCPIT